MKTVFLPRFMMKKEIKWTRGILDVLKNTHPSDSLSFVPYEEIEKIANHHDLLCFYNLVCLNYSLVKLLLIEY